MTGATDSTPADEAGRDPRAQLPGLTTLLELPPVRETIDTHGHDTVVAALRDVLAAARTRIATGGAVPDPDRLAADAITAVTDRDHRRLRAVINATGVLLHTNLGRAPLAADAVAAIAAAAGPTNLEVDLRDAVRGGRGEVVHDTLARLTGAEAALAVNNGAAALVLALQVLGHGRQVVISRGELVEIGGSFRLPDIMEAAGCVLREVGTTNRTHVEDYRRAIGPDTGAVLRVHPSNFRVDGFTHRPPTEQIAEVTHAAGVPFIDDLGSGLLAAHPATGDEPIAADAVRRGADLALFSGDKLLGGPQAGILVGRADLIERCRRAPLARALRLDKLRLAALEATVATHERGDRDALPLWSQVAAEAAVLRGRAEAIAATCGGEVVPTEAVLGGGSTPGRRLASFGVALPGNAEKLAQRLRTGEPPVLARIVDDLVVADVRAVPADLDTDLARALRVALDGT